MQHDNLARVETKTTPIDHLSEAYWKIRDRLHNLIVEAKSAPEVTRAMELRILALQEELTREAVKQLETVMQMNRELTEISRAFHTERDNLASENKELWEAAMGGKPFTHHGNA